MRVQVHSEIRIHAALSHPHICPLYGAFAAPGGDVVLVMRYASLGSVSEHLSHLGGAVSEPYAVARLLRPLLSAVDYLHSHAVLHRDIKIENVVVDGESGDAQLMDFGLAVDVAARAPVSRLGTPAYMVRALSR